VYPDVQVYKHTMNAVLIHQNKTLIMSGYRAVLNDMSGWKRKGRGELPLMERCAVWVVTLAELLATHV